MISPKDLMEYASAAHEKALDAIFKGDVEATEKWAKEYATRLVGVAKMSKEVLEAERMSRIIWGKTTYTPKKS